MKLISVRRPRRQSFGVKRQIRTKNALLWMMTVKTTLAIVLLSALCAAFGSVAQAACIGASVNSFGAKVDGYRWQGKKMKRFSQWLILAFSLSLLAGCGGLENISISGGGGGAASLAAIVVSTGNFSSGEQGATYSITVSNTGTAATSGTVTVADPPTGFTVTAIGGPLWTCTLSTLICTNGNPLAAGQSFTKITVTGNVTAANGTHVTIPLTLSGGGAPTMNVTPTPSVTVTAPTCPLPALGNESLLNGTYVVALNGWEDGVGPSQAIGAFLGNGTGGVTNGELDSGKVVVGATQSAPKLETISGCFQVGPDFRGLMIWNLTGGGSETLAFVLSSDGTFGDIMEFDDQDPGTSPGVRASGDFNIEAGGPFTLASFSGPFGFEAKGYSPNGNNTDYLRERKIGRFDDSTSGVVTNGAVDAAIATGTGTQTNIDNQSFTGNFTAPDSLGRGTATFTYPNFNNAGPLTLNFAYYLNDGSDLVMVSTDTPDNSGHAMDHGFVTTQLNGPYGAGSLSGNAVFYMIGADLSANHSFTVAGVGQVAGDGLGGASVRLDEVSNGSVVATGTSAISGGSFTVSPNGMGVLTIGSGGAARKFSVAMYDKNFGNMLEGTAASPGSNLIIGEFRAQTAPVSGFAEGTFSGPYGIGTNRQASANSTFEVGTVTTPTPQTNPPSFSGAIDRSSGNGCNTGCLSSNQAVSATFSVDANGRITIAPTSGGGGPAVGWFRNKGNGFWIISDTSDVNATILN
jgi:hypothetical protein